MGTFGISVVICIYNGAKRIIPTLKALSRQNIPSGLPCELIIIDNASTDSTAGIAEEFWKNIRTPFPLSCHTETKPGKANALVLGYNKTKYELMLVCDDDNWLQPDYFKTVAELYTANPHIGLLGGYGKALFNPNEKPKWFNSWENCYVCGKHHIKNGLLDNEDFSIWGAGSVLPKTIWKHLISSGFTFNNSTSKGKAMSEDAELSMAISFTGNPLYFDDRLWLTHDLRGGRVTWKNFLEQQSWNGKTNAVLYMYQLAYDNPSLSLIKIDFLFVRKIMGLMLGLGKSLLKPNNRPRSILFYNIIKELLSNSKNYKKKAVDSLVWINKIRYTKKHVAFRFDKNSITN